MNRGSVFYSVVSLALLAVIVSQSVAIANFFTGLPNFFSTIPSVFQVSPTTTTSPQLVFQAVSNSTDNNTANAATTTLPTTTTPPTTTVNPPLSISLTANPTTVNVNQTVSFTNETSGGTGTYSSYTYTVNASSGYTINNNNIATFSQPGTYSVNETVVDSSGASATSNPVTINVSQPSTTSIPPPTNALNNTSTNSTVPSNTVNTTTTTSPATTVAPINTTSIPPLNATLGPTPRRLPVGKVTDITVIATGGTQPYTYQWYEITPKGVQSNPAANCVNQSATSSTCQFLPKHQGDYYLGVNVTDASGTIFNIDPYFLATNLTLNTSIIINTGTSIATGNVSGGSGNYLATWTVYGINGTNSGNTLTLSPISLSSDGNVNASGSPYATSIFNLTYGVILGNNQNGQPFNLTDGNYTVTFAAEDAANPLNTSSSNAILDVDWTVVVLPSSNTISLDQAATFTAHFNSNDDSYPPYTWSWTSTNSVDLTFNTLCDSSTTNSSTCTVTPTHGSNTLYTITATATNSRSSYNNCGYEDHQNCGSNQQSSGTATLTVTNALVITSFTANTYSISPGGSVLFSNTITGGTGSNKYAMSFSPSNGVTHVSDGIWSFADPGNYLVTLTVNDISGETASNSLTITVAQQTGTLKIVKDTVGGNGLFSFTGSGGSTVANSFQVQTTSGTGNTVFNNVQVGTYSVTENVPTGWALTNSVCSSGTPNSITVTPGNTVTCTFTDTAKGTIIVQKNLVGGSTGTFNFTTTGGDNLPSSFKVTTSGGTGSNTFANLNTSKTFAITENVPANWALTGSSCSNGDPVNAISVTPGNTVTCTFTDTAKGTIIVQKNLVGGSTGTFNFTTTGGDNLPSSFKVTTSGGTGSNTFANLNTSKTFAIAETVPTGWQLESSSCSNGNSVNSISVNPGNTITCTFTDKKQGTITVVKNTVNGNGLFQFTTTGGSTLPSTFTINTVPSNTGSQTFNNVNPDNTYSVVENVPVGWVLSSSGCTSGSPSSFTVAPGAAVTCTFTDNPKLVTKLNANWTYISTGQGVRFTNTTSGGTGGYTFSYTFSPSTGVSQNGNVFTFNSAGNYLATLTVNDITGEIATSNVLITVALPLTVTLIPSNSWIVGSPQSVTFSNTVTGGTGNVLYSYTVNALNGGTATYEGNNIFQFTHVSVPDENPTIYKVTLYVSDTTGETNQSTAMVYDNETLTVNSTKILYPGTENAANTVYPVFSQDQSITDLNLGAQGGAPPYTYKWIIILPNGNALNANCGPYNNPSTTNTPCVFQTSSNSPLGTYNFKLLVTDTQSPPGAEYAAEEPFILNTSLVITQFKANWTYISADQKVKFTNVTTGGTGADSWTYNVLSGPNGGAVYLGNNVWQFNAAGNYLIGLTVTDISGENTTANVLIDVTPPLATQIHASMTYISADQNVAFWNVSTGGTGSDVNTYTVSPTTGTVVTGSIITFNTAGNYVVTLTTNDLTGEVATSNVLIQVTPPLTTTVTANRTYVSAGQNVAFWNVSTGGTGSDVNTYSVSPTTGTTVNGNIITFNTAGNYLVTLTVNDLTGEVASSNVLIQVTPPLTANLVANWTYISADQKGLLHVILHRRHR